MLGAGPTHWPVHPVCPVHQLEEDEDGFQLEEDEEA